MIRRYKAGDLEQIMPLWLETTIAAHTFIDEDYWRQAQPLVEHQYIPDSDTFVYEQNQEILGFISILNNNLIGALFVKQGRQKTGIGKALMKYVQSCYPLLLLEVYPQNKRAYQFYRHMGFTTVSEEFNQETGAVVETMSWTRLA